MHQSFMITEKTIGFLKGLHEVTEASEVCEELCSGLKVLIQR